MLSERLGNVVVPDSAKKNLLDETKCYETFKGIVSDTDKMGLKLILSFDEFGTITSSDKFDPDFFSFFRSIANNHECAYITTSRLKLQKLCRSSNVSESPFFNIFTPVPLGQFDKSEAISLIFKPSEEAGIKFFDEDAEFILNLSGYHPLFIQMACASLFDYKVHNNGSSAKVNFNEVKSNFLVEANEQFEQIWHDEDETERQVLSIIATGSEIDSHEQYVVRELQRKGYLTEEQIKLFSEAFLEFVLSKNPERNIPKQTGKQERSRSSFRNLIGKFFKRS